MKRLAVVLVLPLLAGCGGSSGSSSGGAEKAAYIAKAEAICTSANDATKALPKPTSVAAFSTYVQQVVSLAKAASDGLSGLTPPAKDKAQLEQKVLMPLAAQLAEAETYAQNVEAATQKNDQAALSKLATNAPTQTRADLAYMRDYGFTSCVDAADTSSH